MKILATFGAPTVEVDTEGEPGGNARERRTKQTKKTTQRGKPGQTEIKQQRKTLGVGQTI